MNNTKAMIDFEINRAFLGEWIFRKDEITIRVLEYDLQKDGRYWPRNNAIATASFTVGGHSRSLTNQQLGICTVDELYNYCHDQKVVLKTTSKKE